MRFKLALAILVGTAPAAFAQGFEIVVPNRPGVPIVVNGVEVNYSVLEGSFGLGKGVNNQPTIYGGRPVPTRTRSWSLLSDPRPEAGLWPARNRAAGQPQAATAGRELSPILGRAVGAESADASDDPAGSAVLSAARDPGAARGDDHRRHDFSGPPGGAPSQA